MEWSSTTIEGEGAHEQFVVIPGSIRNPFEAPVLVREKRRGTSSTNLGAEVLKSGLETRLGALSAGADSSVEGTAPGAYVNPTAWGYVALASLNRVSARWMK
jgi:hypothetical protein